MLALLFILTGTAMPVAPTSAPTGARAQTRTIYLNRNGVTLTPGPNNSRANTSSLVVAPTTVPAWTASDALWTDTVACMRETFAPFDVAITETDPGATPHLEAVFGGSPAMLGLPMTAAGVSPMRTDCGVIEGSIAFAFTDVMPQKAQIVCAVMAQEIGHSFGLDHELLAADPMSYLPYAGHRAFQDQTAACGETTPRPCGAPGNPACRASQSSYQLLLERLGAAGTGDIDPPTLAITSPADGTTVEPGFAITATVADDVAVARVTLAIDGTDVAARTVAPWSFTASDTLEPGPHLIELTATDGTNETTEMRMVTIDGPPNTPLAGCSASRGDGGWLLALGIVLVRRRRR
jgi:hypothetical protein